MTRILIIEDNSQLRLMLGKMLVAEGLDVRLTSAATRAIALLRVERFDLVITDIFMPEGSGYSIIDEIRKNHPNVRIIAMSGGSLLNASTSLEFASIKGADKCFQKPFDIADFLSAVHELSEKLPAKH